MSRILLSVPHLGGREVRHVGAAFASNWVSTVGPQLEEFERAFEARLGLPSLAVASGTAAIHLGLRLLGVGPGDEVLVSDLTFVASVNPIRYLGATPVLVDSDPATWTMSPALLAEALEERARRGRLPRAVVVVHLYGQCADLEPILAACARHDVPVLEDAAEALGASYRGRPAGTLGDVGAFSFNGNKIITCSGGGMLVARGERVAKARHWATQAREARAEYRRRPRTASPPAGCPASSWTKTRSGRAATTSSPRSRPPTSRRDPCGSRCTSSRSTPDARRSAAP